MTLSSCAKYALRHSAASIDQCTHEGAAMTLSSWDKAETAFQLQRSNCSHRSNQHYRKLLTCHEKSPRVFPLYDCFPACLQEPRAGILRCSPFLAWVKSWWASRSDVAAYQDNVFVKARPSCSRLSIIAMRFPASLNDCVLLSQPKRLVGEFVLFAQC